MGPGVVVLGGINMDLVVTAPRFPRPGETVVGHRFFTSPGGKGANQAVACARMGARTWLVGRVGADAFGGQLLRSLEEAGVDTSLVGRDPQASSGVALITLDEAGQNSIVQVLGANGRCGAEEVGAVRKALQWAGVFLFPLEVPLEALVEAAREARRLGRTVVCNPAPPRPLPPELLGMCHYLTPNETEASALAGFPVTDTASARRAARQLLRETGARGVVITLGALGAYYASEEGEGHCPAFPVPVVDTVGAGDAFNGALAVRLAGGMALPEAVRWACAAGALCVTRQGAQASMPRREEVEALLRGR